MSFWPFVATIALAAETTINPFLGNLAITSPSVQPSISFGTLSQAKNPTNPLPSKHYIIALLGDSMIDTLGSGAPDITSGLTEFFPNDSFTLLNYGVGATTIDYGITRITQPYSYLGKEIPALMSTHADLVVVESFGYNPYPDGVNGLVRYKKQLTKLMSLLTTTLPGTPIIMAVTIAPNSKIFADGAPGISFSPGEKLDRVEVIQQYLKAALQFAKDYRLPLADAYTASLTSSGDGDPMYINTTDHIHYSAIGRMLFTQKILETIESNHLIQ